MKAALISLGSVSSKLTLEAMEKYFDKVDMINIKNIEIILGSSDHGVYADGKRMPNYECVYPKGSFRYNPILRAISSAIFSESYVPIKPSAFTIGHDKFLTHLILQQAGIPMPGTYIASSVSSARKLLERVNYPIILKLPHGTQGKGVLYADSFPAASSILDTLSSLKQPFIVQEYVETSGTDIRAIVLGDKVIAAMKRRAVTGEKRANIHIGGVGEPVVLDSKTKKIAVKAAQTLGIHVGAVDILESVKGPVVIEINLSPGLQGIMQATKLDIPDMIAKYLFEQTKKFNDTQKLGDSSKILSDIAIDGSRHEIISQLDFRGDRILLPEIITKMGKFSENEEYVISIKEQEVGIRKFS